MNQKELNEIRRRFKLDKNSISRIYGCYVNSSREIIAYIDESMGLMSQEEQEMYLGLLKRPCPAGWAGISSTSNFHSAGGRQRRAPPASGRAAEQRAG